MQIVLSNGGETITAEVANFSEVGVLREDRYIDQRENIGAPGSYTFAVNGVGVGEDHKLQPGDTVTFRPRAGEKGV